MTIMHLHTRKDNRPRPPPSTRRTNRTKLALVIVIILQWIIILQNESTVTVLQDYADQVVSYSSSSYSFLRLQQPNTTISTAAAAAATGPYAKTAIVTLVTNMTMDLLQLCRALESLRHLRDENATRILVFHEGNLKDHHKTTLQNRCGTTRAMSFPVVDFEHDYPDGFDFEAEEPNFFKRNEEKDADGKRKRKWGYHQMIRFYLTRLWDHEAMDDVEVYMRLDTDSCWNNQSVFAPVLNESQVYIRNRGQLETRFYSRGIVDWSQNYIAANNVTPTSPNEWFGFLWAFNKTRRCRSVFNNFEVANVTFMRQPHVRHFHESVTEREPFGVFCFRWGDAVLRFVMLSLFAPPSALENIHGPIGYEHPCVSYDVRDASLFGGTEDEG